MRTEPAIDRDGLRALLAREYAITDARLEFVPAGFSSISYRVGSAYFVKLYPPSSVAGRADELLDIQLPLLEALAGQGIRARLPVAVRTTAGRQRTSFEGMPVVLFPLLPGAHGQDHVGWPASQAIWIEMAGTMADIHKATPALCHVPVDREAFGPLIMPALDACLSTVGDRADELQRYLDRFAHVEAHARSLEGPRVLCHRDFGGSNLLVDEAGKLSVLDWDWPAIAPPEHDLWIAVYGDLRAFLDAYWAAGGVRQLHRVQFEYAILRRGLEDLGARVARLMRADLDDEEAEALLDGIQRWGFGRLASADLLPDSFD